MPGPAPFRKRPPVGHLRAGHARPLQCFHPCTRPGCSRRVCRGRIYASRQVRAAASTPVGAGHARPCAFPQAPACGTPAGRACPAPTVFSPLYTTRVFPESLWGTHICVPASSRRREHPGRGRACPALCLSASARLWDTRGPGMPGPYCATINCVIVMILRILLKISSVYGKIRR